MLVVSSTNVSLEKPLTQSTGLDRKKQKENKEGLGTKKTRQTDIKMYINEYNEYWENSHDPIFIN